MEVAGTVVSSHGAAMRFGSRSSATKPCFVTKRTSGTYRNVNPEDAYVVFINFYNRALEFATFNELQSDDESVLGDTAHSHPAKRRDYGSLISTLEWAHWKQQRNWEKKRRKSIGNTWLMSRRRIRVLKMKKKWKSQRKQQFEASTEQAAEM